LNNERSLSLKLWLPILVAATLSAIWGMTAWKEFRHLEMERVSSAKTDALVGMVDLQSEVELYFRAGDPDGAKQAIRLHVEGHGYEQLVLAGPTGVVEYSATPSMIGKSAAAVVIGFDLPEFLEHLLDDRRTLTLTGDDNDLTGYFPILTWDDNSDSEPTVWGALVLSSPIDIDAASIWADAFRSMLPLLALIIVALVVMVSALHALATRPARHLLSAAQGRAMGMSDSISRITRSGDLHNSEQNLRDVLRLVKVGFYSFSVTSDSWTSSDELDSIFGIGADFERTVEGWLSLVHPDDRQLAEAHLQDFILNNVDVFDLEYRVIDQSSNEVRWVHGMGTLEVDKEGKPVTMLGAIQDISELREGLDALNECYHHHQPQPQRGFLVAQFLGPAG